MYAVSVSVASIVDPILFGDQCPQCKEYLSDQLFDRDADIYDHRKKCPAGHYYWGCHIVERGNHKYCPDHPTDCPICSGAGCYICWDPDKKVPICLRCGASGAHHCPNPDSESESESSEIIAAGGTYEASVTTDEPYFEVNWYIKRSGETGLGTWINANSGNGMTTEASLCYIIPNNASGDYVITAHVTWPDDSTDQVSTTVTVTAP